MRGAKSIADLFIRYTGEYKIKPCKNKSHNDPKTAANRHLCFFYHDVNDFRRYWKTTEIDQKGDQHEELTYSSFYTESRPERPEDCDHCFNGYEYFYHPKNYKTTLCKRSEGICGEESCPYYHDEAEKRICDEQRKALRIHSFRDDRPGRSEMTKPMLRGDSHEMDLGAHLDESLRESVVNMITANIDEESGSFYRNSKIGTPLERKTQLKAHRQEGWIYVYGEKVEFIGDYDHHYKAVDFGTIDMYKICKQICVLLNGKGGTLYLGINGECVVEGYQMGRKERDSLQLAVDESLRRFTPDVSSTEYSVKYLRIWDPVKMYLIEDLFIVEIEVKSKRGDTLFFTNYLECWMRDDGDLILLNAHQIKERYKYICKKNLDPEESKRMRLIDFFSNRDENVLRHGELSIKELEKMLQTTQQAIKAESERRRKRIILTDL
eukprot:TRINITY_DN7132_c0_g2_i9.p1 TRINITY_DN7132_c0_g2~~TRINITY_DN7132_c0_g2_i9.p1  ORF type:complete len:436 (+),score=26.74 TRINITY_DN7132_c0_g2_i9:496-1803(+)